MPAAITSERRLAEALRLAAKGRYRVAPNPLVGAVVERQGQVVGAGFHQQVGGPHAEIEALNQAGDAAREATLYVNLEPCSHHGRTPPCVDAVLAAGIARVVICHRDPNPAVGGQGARRLRAAGVEVESGILLERAVRLNWVYLTWLAHRRPGVTLKWAMSLDGRIATTSGDSRWVSSPAGRRWGLDLREEHDAILVGSGTVLSDDPRLTRRRGKTVGPIVRVVLDRRLRVPATARLFGEPGPVVVYTECSDRRRHRRLTAAGAAVVVLPEVTPSELLADLGQRRIHSVLVEGGAEVHAAFVAAGDFDRVAVDCAAKLIGGYRAPGPVGGTGVDALEQAHVLEEMELGRRGEDIIIRGFRRGCLQDLYASVAD